MKIVKPDPYLPTEKHIYTLLKYLSEGDCFSFVNKDGTRKPGDYYVEDQYPKFGCTTVINDTNIIEYGKDTYSTNQVTAVENDQVVFLWQKKSIRTKHVIYSDKFKHRFWEEYDFSKGK